MTWVVITGASRGIGMGLTKEFLARPEAINVIATCRNPQTAKGLLELSNCFGERLKIVELEVTSDDSIKKAIEEISVIVGDNGVNVLINNAGILVEYVTDQEPSRENLMTTMETNAVSPVIITQTMLPLLKKAAASSTTVSAPLLRSTIINISSFVASNAQNDGSTPLKLFAQRMSKAALTIATTTMSIDLKDEGVMAVAFNPGWVQTDMGGAKAEISTDDAVKMLVCSFFKLRLEHNGGFFDNNGAVIPY